MKDFEKNISFMFHKIDEKIGEYKEIIDNSGKNQELKQNENNLNDSKYELNVEINNLKNLYQWQNIINYGICFGFLLFIFNKMYKYLKKKIII